MATVRPFPAIRPARQYVERVISLPYDVMNRLEASEMAGDNPHSFLHISRSEIDMPLQEDAYDPSVYEKARENLTSFLEQGIFVQEEAPALYIYRQEMDGRIQTGIVGCVAVDEYLDNTIKKHELTRVEKEQDRINHFDVCNTNTEPVFLAYREDPKIRTLMEDWICKHQPVYDIQTKDKVKHQFWVVDEKSFITEMTEAFQSIPTLYIADGHHRSASACKVGLKRRKEHPDLSGNEEFNFFMAAIFPDHDLSIFDYNRVVKDLNGYKPSEFLQKVEKAGFKVEAQGEKPFTPTRKHCFGMFLDGCWYRLQVQKEIIPNHAVDSLDVALLQNFVLAPILGIQDPRTDKRIDFVGGIRGLGELERRCREDMQVAFAVYPVSISDLLQVSDQGMIMPPKSTWFEPKLGSGLFLHAL